MLICIYKRIISLALALSMLAAFALFLSSCSKTDDDGASNDGASNDGSVGGPSGDGDGGEGGSTEGDDSDNSDKPSVDYHDKVFVPPYKDYERLTVDFDKMVYSRPNFAAINGKVDEVVTLIREAELTFEEQIARIDALDPDIINVLTMNSFATIYNAKDSSSEFWCAEVDYFAANYSSFLQATEQLYVAAANSPHAERFEDEYFGEGLIEQYRAGGILTDTVVKLIADEESLEAQYNALSSSTVTITFAGETDTLDRILEKYKLKYGENSAEYLGIEAQCLMIFEERVGELCTDIFISLLQVRRLIADELGYESYAQYAYEGYGRDYSPKDTSDFLSDIAEYVVPVLQQLYRYVFYHYFQNAKASDIELDELINGTYEILLTVDEDFADVFAYMLQHDLYDIELGELNRQDGGFTNYLYKYEAPFIFITANGDITDYSTLFHEFGHFLDAYLNDGLGDDLDRSEIFSQALELMSLCYMEEALGEDDAKYLLYNALFSALDVLVFQGFYARIEELVYAIPYESLSTEGDAREATLELLNGAVMRAAEEFGFNSKLYNDISYVFIPHVFIYPFYVSSYCTSIVPALELYFMERDESGAGIEAFTALISCGELELDAALGSAGLSSPFDEGVLRAVADKINFIITGSHFYDNEAVAPLAA